MCHPSSLPWSLPVVCFFWWGALSSYLKIVTTISFSKVLGFTSFSWHPQVLVATRLLVRSLYLTMVGQHFALTKLFFEKIIPQVVLRIAISSINQIPFNDMKILLDKNTWQYLMVCKLFVLDGNTRYHLTMWNNIVLYLKKCIVN